MLEGTDFEKLVEQAIDESRRLDDSTLSLLSGMSSEEATIFIERWSLTSLGRRRDLLRRLVELGESNFEMDFGAIFKRCLDDEDAEVRRTAVAGLWEDESPSLVQPLVRTLMEDPSAAVRGEAAIALGRFAQLAEMGELDDRRSGMIRDALSSVVHNRGEALEVRRRAIESIAYLSLDNLRQIIDEAYEDDNRLMQVSAVLAMGRSADPFWKGTVVSELNSEDSELRSEAARACGELGARAALPVLTRLIEDRDVEVQGAAIWALGQMGGEEAKRVLFACCESDDDLVRESAEEALAELELGVARLDMLEFELNDDLLAPTEGSEWSSEP